MSEPKTRFERVVGGYRAPLSRRGWTILGLVAVVAVGVTIAVLASNTRGQLAVTLLIPVALALVFGYVAIWSDILTRVNNRLLRSSLPDRTKTLLWLTALFVLGLGPIALMLAATAVGGDSYP